MKISGPAAVAFALLTIGTAGTAAFAEDPKQLSGDELRQLLAGATVVVTYESGNTVRWTNETDGTLSADWNNSPESGTGTWHVSDEGKFCARIEWPKNVTDWCRPVGKSGDGTYVLESVSGSPSWSLTISK
jgi:hypothetical protein